MTTPASMGASYFGASGIGVSIMVMASVVMVREATYSRRRRNVSRRLIPGGSAVTSVPVPVAVSGTRMPLQLPMPAWFACATRRAVVPVEPHFLWSTWVISGALITMIVWLSAGWGPAVLVAAVSTVFPPMVLWTMRERFDDRFRAALPLLLESVARSMRSGASLRQAVEESVATVSGPMREDLLPLLGDMSGGITLSDALARWEERRPLPGVRLAVAALSLGAETGGAHARAIDGVAATLRSELGLAAEIRALSSQARYSALVLVAAPLVFASLAAATDASTATFLLRTPAGWACLVAGLALDGVAALWMQRLSRVEL